MARTKKKQTKNQKKNKKQKKTKAQGELTNSGKVEKEDSDPMLSFIMDHPPFCAC